MMSFFKVFGRKILTFKGQGKEKKRKEKKGELIKWKI